MAADWKDRVPGFERVYVSINRGDRARLPWTAKLGLFVGAAVFIVIAAVILVPALILGSVLFLVSLLVGAVRGLLSSDDDPGGSGGIGGRNGSGRENVRVLRR